MKYRIMLFRAISASIVLVSIITVYILNQYNQVSVSLEDNVTIDYAVNPVFFPSQTARFDWHVEHIVAVSFNQGGVIGQDFRVKTVELCKSNIYILDVVLPNNQDVSFSLQPNIFVFDPLFVSLVVLLMIQCYYLFGVVIKRIGYTIVPNGNSNTIARTMIKQFALITFSGHIVLPIIEISLKTLSCT